MTHITSGERGRPRPPLTKRMRRGHWIALDCAAGVLAALGATAATLGAARPGPVVRGIPDGPHPGQMVLAVALPLVVFAAVGFRRLRPVPAFGALVFLAGAVYTVTGEASVATVMLLSAAYVVYIVAVETARRTGAAALGLALLVDLAVFLESFVRTHVRDGGGIPVAFVLVICWMIGHSVRQRRVYADTLREQATASAVAEERLRIARELHDVVAHSMSVIAVQAGFGQYVIDSSPGDARNALDAIQSTSRDALEEMRLMLGVLRESPGSSGGSSGGAPPRRTVPLAPAPGLDGLDRLIDRVAGTGLRVTLERPDRARSVPAGVDLSAYRIIQEALTNVVKHAGPDAACTVSVRCPGRTLVVEVTDDGGSRAAPPPPPGESGGHGLAGMRERAALCGGSLEAGPVPGRGFRVTATLPLQPEPVLAGEPS